MNFTKEYIKEHSTEILNVGENALFFRPHQHMGYIMRIFSMNATTVSLKIDSMEETFDVHLNEVQIIDTDGDGEKDLAIFLNGVNLTSQKASITLYPYSEPEDAGINMVVVSILAMFLVGLVIMVVIVLVARRISRKTGVPESGKKQKKDGS